MKEVPPHTSLAPLASPCFVLCLLRVEREGLVDYQGGSGSSSLYGGTFAGSYLVSNIDNFWGNSTFGSLRDLHHSHVIHCASRNDPWNACFFLCV